MKKKIAHEVVESSNQNLKNRKQLEIDNEILLVMQKKKEEKEALKKLLVNLNEPITNKRKHHKYN